MFNEKISYEKRRDLIKVRERIEVNEEYKVFQLQYTLFDNRGRGVQQILKNKIVKKKEGFKLGNPSKEPDLAYIMLEGKKRRVAREFLDELTKNEIGLNF